MDDHEWLAEQFEENRGHLRAVAYRMLGSLGEADVQEAWLRLSRSDTSGVLANTGRAAQGLHGRAREGERRRGHWAFTEFLARLVEKRLAGEPLPEVPKTSA